MIEGARLDELTEGGRAKAIASLLAECRELVGKGRTLEDELTAFLRLPPEKQRVVDRRLAEFARFIGTKRATSDVDAAAARVGMARRNFYRLLAKMEKAGPVRALAPHVPGVTRPSTARTGLPAPIDGALQSFLQAYPETRIARAEEFVRRMAKELRLDEPSASMIRRRVNALRRSSVDVPSSGLLGASVIVDQTALNLRLPDGGRMEQAIVTMVIDRSTGFILTHDMALGDAAAEGLGKAVIWGKHSLYRPPPDVPVRAAPALEEIEWVPPFGMEPVARVLENAERDGPALKIAKGGERRHGVRIQRAIGDRLGEFELLPRSTEKVARAARPFGERKEERRHVLATLRAAVHAWNRQRQEKLAVDEVLSPEEQEARHARLERLGHELCDYFLPIIHESEALRLQSNAGVPPGDASPGPGSA